MNIDKLMEELKVDEGCVMEIYNDHLGYPTFGVGHLIREDDPEHDQPLGTIVSDERVREAFEQDLDSVRRDCLRLYGNFTELPDDCQLIIANMMFNLGYPRLSKFKLMKAAIEKSDWEEAANQMESSRWYRQVPNRAERLCNRMRLLAVPV
jgi:lysozyme